MNTSTNTTPTRSRSTQVAPQNLKAERSMLGEIIADGERFGEIKDLLKPEDFYLETHRQIFRAALGLAADELPIDIVTLDEELRRAGITTATAADLAALVEHRGPNIKHYAKLIVERAKKRKLRSDLAQAQDTLDAAPIEEVVEGLKSKIDDLRDDESKGRKIETLADLMRKRIPSRDYFLGGGLIARGDLVVFSGPQKKGKSLLALNLALCMAKGEPWLGLQMPKPLRVGIIQQEVPEGGLKERLRKMLGDGTDFSFLERIPHLTRQGLKLDTKKGYDDLCRWLDETRVDLLQLDPLYQLHTGDENNPKDMGRIFDSLERIRKVYNIAVLIIHHHGKPGQTERSGGDLHRGTSLIRDVTDANWTFTKVSANNNLALADSPANYVHLNFEQRHCEEPDPLLLHLDHQSLWFDRVDAKQVTEVRIEEVAELVAAAGSVFQDDLIEGLKQKFGAKERVVRDAIYEARDSGLIVAGRDGHRRTWQPTNSEPGKISSQFNLAELRAEV